MRQCKWCRLMQVAPSLGQICNLWKWRHLVAIFATNASGAIWWPNLQLMQVAPSGGQICSLCKWCHIVAKFNPGYGVNFWVRCASGNVFWTPPSIGPHLFVSKFTFWWSSEENKRKYRSSSIRDNLCFSENSFQEWRGNFLHASEMGNLKEIIFNIFLPLLVYIH